MGLTRAAINLRKVGVSERNHLRHWPRHRAARWNRASASLASVTSNPNGIVASNEPDGDQVWLEIQRDPCWLDWQEGRITAQKWCQHVTQRSRLPMTYKRFCAAWNSVLDPEILIPETVFAQLATLHKLGLLSNTDPDSRRRISNVIFPLCVTSQ
jgi:hypothetical protein